MSLLPRSDRGFHSAVLEMQKKNMKSFWDNISTWLYMYMDVSDPSTRQVLRHEYRSRQATPTLISKKSFAAF